MTEVNMDMVKELRERTQAKLNDCRNAVIQSGGDLDKAIELILKKGQADSIKRSGTIASEGVVGTQLDGAGTTGVIAEINIQTDFAARNPEFLGFVDTVLLAALKTEAGKDLGSQPYPGDLTVDDARNILVARLGENIQIRRWERLAVSQGRVASYNHLGGKIAVLVAAETPQGLAIGPLLSDIAMQIAAMNPLYVSIEDIPEKARASQEEIFMVMIKDEGKIPEARVPQVVAGKIQKWAKEVCLMEQASVIDPKKSIAQVIKDAGFDIQKISFIRYERGEGLVVDKGDFASEVAAMAQN